MLRDRRGCAGDTGLCRSGCEKRTAAARSADWIDDRGDEAGRTPVSSGSGVSAETSSLLDGPSVEGAWAVEDEPACVCRSRPHEPALLEAEGQGSSA
jgi:hypothetical protein